MTNTTSLLQRLIAECQLTPNPGATNQEIDSFEKTAGLTLPASARDLFAASNGLVLVEGELVFESLEGSLKYPESFFSSPWGFVPFVDNNDSNPWCICSRSPLSGFVIQVCHDAPEPVRLMFRSLDRFLEAVRLYLKDADGWLLDNLPSDYSGCLVDGRASLDRTANDVKIGRELLRFAGQVTGQDHHLAIGFGITLLSENQVDEIISLLQDEDHYVVESVRWRLQALNTPRAVQALAEEQAELKVFAQQCVALLKKSGIRASLHDNGTSIRLDDGPSWLNFEYFFCRRRRSDAAEELIQKARDILSPKKK